MHTKALITIMLIAVSPFASAASASAVGPANPNPNTGCVAQLIPTEAPPGASVPTIKLYVTPVPGHLISVVARMDKSACELPS